LSAEERDRLAAQTLRIVRKGEDLEVAIHRTLEQLAGFAPGPTISRAATWMVP
jgi:hypothetical protein